MTGDGLPGLCAGSAWFLPRRRSSAFRLLLPEVLEELEFELVFEVDDEPDIAFEDSLSSFFSSWMLMLLFPPRRGTRSLQRA